MQTHLTDIQTIVDEITHRLEKLNQKSVTNPSYETGLLGYSLYYALLAKYKDEPQHIQTAESYFEKAMDSLDIENFQRVYDTDSIDGHLSHIGRFLLYVKENGLLEIDSDAYLLQLDEILTDLMESKVSIKDFDSLSGAMASGFYFLARQEAGIDLTKQITFIIHSLENFAERDRDGDYFWKSPSLYQRIYLGISHGSAMMISFLTRAKMLKIEEALCARIMEKACNFIRKQYRISPYKGLFPNMVGEPIEPMQFALCYGDLGVGYALFKAAKSLNDDALMSFSKIVLDDCLLRSKDDNLTLDASVFYGASGLVIAFEKMYQESGDQAFKDRSAYWYDQINNYKTRKSTFAGFESRLDKDDMLWNIAFGWGILGIGCTLMCYENDALPPLSPLTFIA